MLYAFRVKAVVYSSEHIAFPLTRDGDIYFNAYLLMTVRSEWQSVTQLTAKKKSGQKERTKLMIIINIWDDEHSRYILRSQKKEEEKKGQNNITAIAKLLVYGRDQN